MFNLRRNAWTTVVVGCLLTVVVVFGYSLQNGSDVTTQTARTTSRTDDPERPFARFVFEWDDILYDLSDGDYLVALMSATCPYCKEETNRLSELPELFPQVPPVIGLCLGTEPELKMFREKTKPNFPIFKLDPLTFIQLIGQTPPRFILIRDGKPLKYWDERVPELLELAETME